MVRKIRNSDVSYSDACKMKRLDYGEKYTEFRCETECLNQSNLRKGKPPNPVLDLDGTLVHRTHASHVSGGPHVLIAHVAVGGVHDSCAPCTVPFSGGNGHLHGSQGWETFMAMGQGARVRVHNLRRAQVEDGSQWPDYTVVETSKRATTQEGRIFVW
jgi:hypothetical protein